MNVLKIFVRRKKSNTAAKLSPENQCQFPAPGKGLTTPAAEVTKSLDLPQLPSSLLPALLLPGGWW